MLNWPTWLRKLVGLLGVEWDKVAKFSEIVLS